MSVPATGVAVTCFSVCDKAYIAAATEAAAQAAEFGCTCYFQQQTHEKRRKSTLWQTCGPKNMLTNAVVGAARRSGLVIMLNVTASAALQ